MEIDSRFHTLNSRIVSLEALVVRLLIRVKRADRSHPRLRIVGHAQIVPLIQSSADSKKRGSTEHADRSDSQH